MGKPGTRDKAKDELSSTVDRLLRKLPFADPHPGRQSKTSDDSGPSRRITGPIAGVARSVAGAPPPTTQEQVGTWARVMLGAIVAAAMLQWPYAHACGLSLGAYLLGVTISIVAGGWGAVSSWNRRMALAHVASIGIVMWGLGLGAAQVLPRIGYAKAAATWGCVDTAAATGVGSAAGAAAAGRWESPVGTPIAPDSAGTADSATVADSTDVGDSADEADSAGEPDSTSAASNPDSPGAPTRG